MINIALLAYPDSSQSALYGWQEMFMLANRACQEQQLSYEFNCAIISEQELAAATTKHFDVLLLPPSQSQDAYLNPSNKLISLLQQQHQHGAILASACAGCFILAATNLLNTKTVTTHWALASLFCERYPEIELSIDKILINQGDVITAGGMMSWLDLGLEVVGQFSQASVMRQLGKILVVDTGQREQRFYQQFIPIFNHGDSTILSVQQSLQRNFAENTSIKELAQQAYLTERTFLRRFVKATRLKPTQYIQKLRIQKACDLLETTKNSFESIASEVGYQDASACRKLFIKIMGLTPSEFRKRFTH